MADRAAPIFVSIAQGHASANAVKATTGGWSTGSSASSTFPLHSHMSSARWEGSEYHFKSLWYDSAGARTHDLPVVRQMLYHWAITPAYICICNILVAEGLFFSCINSRLHYITLCYITLHYITLHYVTLHYITLHYVTLHYITLRYVTLYAI